MRGLWVRFLLEMFGGYCSADIVRFGGSKLQDLRFRACTLSMFIESNFSPPKRAVNISIKKSHDPVIWHGQNKVVASPLTLSSKATEKGISIIPLVLHLKSHESVGSIILKWSINRSAPLSYYLRRKNGHGRERKTSAPSPNWHHGILIHYTAPWVVFLARSKIPSFSKTKAVSCYC